MENESIDLSPLCKSNLLIYGSKNINRTVLKEIAKIQSHQFPRSATAASATRHVGLAKMRGFPSLGRSDLVWPFEHFKIIS